MTTLKQVREGRGLTAAVVAAAVGIDQSYYSKLENGKANASPATAAKLSAYFEGAVTPMEILYPTAEQVGA